MINVYDFDKTIYDGDSSIDFYLFCLKRKKTIILLLPKQVFAMILYKLKIKNKEYFKSQFFSFVKKIDKVDKTIEIFWKQKIVKIKSWYKSQSETTDVIISASPEFLLKPLEKKLKIKVIASKVSKKTGEFLDKNCYGEEKVRRFNEEFNNKKIANFYSDSMSDLPLMKIAEHAYLVKKDSVEEINIKQQQES